MLHCNTKNRFRCSILTLLRTIRIATEVDRARLARDEAYRLAIVAALRGAAPRREG
jgi:hypothetical protein